MLAAFLVAVALAMDAFAVAIGKGLALGNRATAPKGVTIGLWFGGFQAGMPLLGWALASRFAHLIEAWDHWVAFGLLTLLGLNMLRGAFSRDDDVDAGMHARDLLPLAIGTSIDALAAGVGFALGGFDIVRTVVTIGVVTFGLSGLGLRLGSLLGARWQRWATVLGGLVLIGIGVHTLVEHLG